MAGRDNSRFPKGMTERKARANWTGKEVRAFLTGMLGWRQGLTGHGYGAIGGEEEADAVGVAGVEEVGEGSKFGFYGGAVADEVEVVGGGLEAIEMEGEAGIVLVEEDGFD